MIHYKDTTFCVNQDCKKRCSRYLTEEIEKEAKEYGLPLAVTEMICTDVGESNAELQS